MKRIIISASAFLLAVASVSAQDVTDAQKAAEEAAMAIAGAPAAEVKVPKPRYWTNSLLTKIDFGQTNLTNWAAGGYNSVTLKSFIDANANYKKDELFFNNRLQLDYGFLYSEDKPFIQKSDDRMYYEGKFGYKAAKTLNYYPIPSKPDTAPDDWEPGKSDWKANRKVKSGFISPAYTNIAIGIDWVPTKWLTVNIAPLTGGFVVVTDETLRKSYGMELKKKTLPHLQGKTRMSMTRSWPESPAEMLTVPPDSSSVPRSRLMASCRSMTISSTPRSSCSSRIIWTIPRISV